MISSRCFLAVTVSSLTLLLSLLAPISTNGWSRSSFRQFSSRSSRVAPLQPSFGRSCHSPLTTTNLMLKQQQQRPFICGLASTSSPHSDLTTDHRMAAADPEIAEMVHELTTSSAGTTTTSATTTGFNPGVTQSFFNQWVEEKEQEDDDADADREAEERQRTMDEMHMRTALELAHSSSSGKDSPFPKPEAGALLVTRDGRIFGRGRSDYRLDSVQAVIANAGIVATPLQVWCVAWPSSPLLREDLAQSTLYLTMEPSPERRGEILPPLTQLIEAAGIPRVVIGCAHPDSDVAFSGASALHAAGIQVRLGTLQDECEALIAPYARLMQDKLQRMARKHFDLFHRPLGFLHCSVVESTNLEAFARNGNAFGKNFGGQVMGYRDFGAYEIAPPPEVVWADTEESQSDFENSNVDDDDDEDEDSDVDGIYTMEFEDEDYQERLGGNPMTPWYEQVDAVVATFPRSGNGPRDDDSITARLNGLKWLATHGTHLPAGVERILVMDATYLRDLPLTNDDPNLPKGVDVEAFWNAHDRKPTRVLLRRGDSAPAQAAAKAAAEAALAAAQAAQAALEAIESGDASLEAETALNAQKTAAAALASIQLELSELHSIKQTLQAMGVHVEILGGGEPVDVMKHLGKRHGYRTVVWRAGCWGDRGVQAVLAGAFQCVSAHLAVDAVGGKFWQLMLAERAVQAACGPERKVKIFADQDDVSLEYCDAEDADQDCAMTLDGRPIRHVRLDCRVALVEEDRPREFVLVNTKRLDPHNLAESAPWFL